MSVYISTFNPLSMEEHEILALATGREHLLKLLLKEMQVCLKSGTNNHFLLHGPRGIGKSFFTKYLKIKCKRLPQFNNSLFIQLPEEQSNLQFVGDLIEMLCAAIQNQPFQNIQAKWEVNDAAWRSAIKKLKQLIKEQKADKKDFHIFFSMENLQDFIPQLDEIENGRMREFLEQFKDISLIGTSVRPDLDNNYDKRLFHVFKKYPLNPWTLDDCLAYYDKRVAFLKEHGENPLKDVALNRQKVKAISVFTGGSPRIAVILNRLVLEENIESVANTLRGIIDELTPYYQDLTKAMPPKTKLLFDTLIRNGENMTQSKLAELLGKQQNVISKPFRWLKENFYVKAVKQKQGNTYHYSVNDRMYSLYWQQREMLCEGEPIIALLAGFLFQFFGERTLFEKMKEALEKKSKIGSELLKVYCLKNHIEIQGKKNLDIIEEEKSRHKRIDDIKATMTKIESKIKKKPTSQLYTKLGISNFQLGNLIKGDKKRRNKYLDNATSNLEKSFKIKGNETALYFSFFFNLYRGKIENCIKCFKQMMAFNPRKVVDIIRLAEIELSKGRFENAIKLYEACLSLIEPKNYTALVEIGIAHLALGNETKGLKYFYKALEIMPNNGVFDLSVFLTNKNPKARHTIFAVIMTILSFFEKVNPFLYRDNLIACLKTLYIYGHKHLLSDVISEIRSNFSKESRFIELLNVLEFGQNNDVLSKLPLDARVFLEELNNEKNRKINQIDDFNKEDIPQLCGYL